MINEHPRIVVRSFHSKCEHCGSWNVRTEEGGSTVCKKRECHNRRSADYYRHLKGKALVTTECRLCGEVFSQTSIIQKHCLLCRTTDRIRRVWHETVNPRIIFERDGWTCQHCKMKLPESLRGTLAGRAPELDHILPLSYGGAHSEFNTQCLCRACNIRKSDNLENEPRLQGVTNLEPYKCAKYPPAVGDRKEMTCACGCGETFIPSHSNLTGYKHTHWARSQGAGIFVGCYSKWPPTMLKLAIIKRRGF